MDQPPTTSPQLPAFQVRGFFFNDPRYHYQPPRLWHPFLEAVLPALVVVLIFIWVALRCYILKSLPENPQPQPELEIPQLHYYTTPNPEVLALSAAEAEAEAAAAA